MHAAESIQTVIIGGGQAGLAVGYHLRRRHVPFVILEANERVGDNWRNRWDSLRLFTPARYDGIAGLPFPAPRHSFPTKDAMGDYLEAYAARFQLPVRTGRRVERLSKESGHFVIETRAQRITADNVVVAMATFQKARVPDYAAGIDDRIVQLHSSEYRNPAQLQSGSVLVVGAGNSGAEISFELARAGHTVLLSGRDVGHVPFRIDGLAARLLLVRLMFRVVFHRVLTVATPLGRKVRPTILAKGGPLIRVKPDDLARASVQRVPRVVGVREGRPLLEGDLPVDVANIIWCTGFRPGLSWIELPIFGPDGDVLHERGIVEREPGLYFVGLNFLYALSSTMIHGVSRDARRIADHIATRRSAVSTA